MQISHLRTHGYSCWEEFLTDYPKFEDKDWKAHSKRASRNFWDEATSDQISLRKEKQLATWHSASSEEVKARNARRSKKTKESWDNMTEAERNARGQKISEGFLNATTSEHRSEIARKAKSCNSPDQAQRCSLGMQRYWENLTDSEYTTLCRERSRLWSNMSDDEYNSRCLKFKSLWESRPDNDKERLKEIYRKNVRKSFGSKETWHEKACRLHLEELGHKPVRQFSSLLVDLYVPDINLAIELYGTYWHSDPRKLEASYLHPHRKMTASEIWNRDVQKQRKIMQNHNLIVIWERDYSFDTLVRGIQEIDLANPNGNCLWTSLISPRVISAEMPID